MATEGELFWGKIENKIPILLSRLAYDLPLAIRPSDADITAFADLTYPKIREWALAWVPPPNKVAEFNNLSAKQSMDVFKILLLREVRRLRNEWLRERYGEGVNPVMRMKE